MWHDREVRAVSQRTWSRRGGAKEYVVFGVVHSSRFKYRWHAWVEGGDLLVWSYFDWYTAISVETWGIVELLERVASATPFMYITPISLFITHHVMRNLGPPPSKPNRPVSSYPGLWP